MLPPRVFINAGEFHYQRLPVPELWLDIFQKFKANGFNTVSIYFFWSYHSASDGVYDFVTAGKNLQALFDYANDAGLWIIARAGPYCNAESNAGGLALYGSDGSFGNIRSSDETYHSAWLPWIQNIGAIIAANSITEGGPVILNQIENELQETVHDASDTLVQYMVQIEDAFGDAGVIVPSTSNEKGMRSMSWSSDYQDVGGSVDIYGLDSYPGGQSCTNPGKGFTLVRDYYQCKSATTEPVRTVYMSCTIHQILTSMAPRVPKLQLHSTQLPGRVRGRLVYSLGQRHLLRYGNVDVPVSVEYQTKSPTGE